MSSSPFDCKSGAMKRNSSVLQQPFCVSIGGAGDTVAGGVVTMGLILGAIVVVVVIGLGDFVDLGVVVLGCLGLVLVGVLVLVSFFAIGISST